MKLSRVNIILSIIGIIIGLGLMAIAKLVINDGTDTLYKVFFGVGVGLLGISLGRLIYIFMFRIIARNNPKFIRNQGLDNKDERSTLIRDKMGAFVNNIFVGMVFIATFVFYYLDADLYIIIVMAG